MTVIQLARARKPFLNGRGLHCENAYRLLAWVWERIVLTDEDRAAMLAERDAPESA